MTTNEELSGLYKEQVELYKSMKATLDTLATETDTATTRHKLFNLAYLLDEAQINLEFIEQETK